MRFHAAFVDALAAGGVERVEVFAAEAEVGDVAVGGRDDAADAAGGVGDLDAHVGRTVQAAVAVDADAVNAAVVGSVGHVQVEVTLPGPERAVGLDLVAPDPVRTALGDVEQR